MIRAVLPAVLCLVTNSSAAETLRLDPLTPKDPQSSAQSACRNVPYSQDNCVRVLACIGATGLWFDGRALGWDQGVVMGLTSQNIPCTGAWRSGGFLGTGTSTLECRDGLTADVLYYTQDNDTGTVIGRGSDSKGRSVIAWSGENVLKFLTPKGKPNAQLPCGPTPIPLS